MLRRRSSITAWGFLAFPMLVIVLFTGLPAVAGIVWRLLDEEKFLAQNLPGYAAYAARVRHRLVPGVW